MRAHLKLGHQTRKIHIRGAVVARNHVTPAELRAEISQARRADVYRADVAFRDETPARTDWVSPAEVERIRELRERGLSQLAISCELDRSPGTISAICRRHGIVKGVKK